LNIVERSAERLELEHRPLSWMIGLSVIAAVLVIGMMRALADGALGGAGVAAAMLAAIAWVGLTKVFRRISLVADRGAGTLELKTTTLMGEQAEQHALTDFVRAEVDHRYSTTDSSADTGLVLVLGRGDPPDRLRLDLFRPDPADLLQAEQSINGWLGHGAKRPPADTLQPTPGAPTP
jgi:hypothetical protein